MINIKTRKYAKTHEARKQKILDRILLLNERQKTLPFSHINKFFNSYSKDYVKVVLKELIDERKIVMVSGDGFTWFYHADVVDSIYKEFCGYSQKQLDKNFNIWVARDGLKEWIKERDEKK